jgi:hypothetical protein
VAALAALALVFLVLPFKLILLKVYGGYIRQPDYLEGGLELLAVLAVLVAVSSVRQLGAGVSWVMLVICALYLEQQSMLVPTATALVFLEVLVRLGRVTLRFVFRPPPASLQAELDAFVVGVGAWLLMAIASSAVGQGSFVALRWLTLGVAVVTLIFDRTAPCAVHFARQFVRATRTERWLLSVLVTLLLVQLGKANPSLDYDSSWYGLRPERVLIGVHSFFDDLHLAHFVYYYPKAFELLVAPLSGLGEHGFIVAFNVLLLGVALVAVFRLAREFGLGRAPALLVVTLVATTPALVNMASTGKVDNLAHTLSFLMALGFWRFARGRDPLDFAVASAACLLMLATKVTAYAWAPLIAAGFLAVGVRQSATFAASPPRSTWRRAVLVAIPSAVVLAGMCARSWLLTGLPTIPFLVGIWRRVGFTPHYPWTLMDYSAPAPPLGTFDLQLEYWRRMLFDPEPFIHYVMAWPGNATFFAALSALVLWGVVPSTRSRPTAMVMAVVPVALGALAIVTFLPRHNNGGSDGNYYATPIVLVLVALCAWLGQLERPVERVFAVLAGGFIVVQAPIMFASHWSWHPGTSRFSTPLDHVFYGDHERTDAFLHQVGAWELEEHLRTHPGETRCLGYSRDDVALRKLSCRYEDLEELEILFPKAFETDAAFLEFLRWSQVDLVIAPRDLLDRAPTRASERLFQSLRANPSVEVVPSGRYEAFHFKELAASAP